MEERQRSASDLLLYCAGVSREILDKCPESEVRKYRLLGLAVLLPAVMGVFSGGYAIYTTFQSLPAAIALGLIWGFVILTIDRVLILTYRSRKNAIDNFLNGGLWLRLGLAALIALTISKPIEMRLFKDTVDEQIAKRTDLRIEEEIQPYRTRIDSINNELLAGREQLQLSQEEIDRQLQKQRTKVERMQSAFLAEMDGSGGTLQRGIGPIAAQKRVQLEHAEEELWYMEDQTGEQKTQLSTNHAAFVSARKNEIRALERKSERRSEIIQSAASSDLLARLTALNELGQQKPVVRYAGLLLTLIFLFIELIPLLTKAFMRSGPYNFYIENEHRWFKEQTAMEKELDTQVMRDAESFEARKKSDEQVLGLRLDLLEKQVNHTGSYLRLERRFEDMMREREAELDEKSDGTDYKKSLIRLRREFFGLARLARPGIPENEDDTVVENKDLVFSEEESTAQDKRVPTSGESGSAPNSEMKTATSIVKSTASLVDLKGSDPTE